MTTPPMTQVPVRSGLALTRRWAALLSPPVFSARSLWMTWLDGDGVQLPLVLPIDDFPSRPDLAALDGLRQLHDDGLRQLHDTVAELYLADGGHLALALCRPGECVMDGDDDEWAELLREALDDHRIDQTWSLHLAAGGRVVPLVEAPARTWGGPSS
ncbi:hypothetical protein OF117_02855 [Geodermatophilus sp. YIM 151500]|uniref:hypothetical protein n=1 Tax=Geodermatophilus sp. YIM 151500 TaxID=2984531 RepID=UPI0021E3E8B2|nr:hypothetical protein [Geodermatophilus sp. YIM 151500]MCV2488289.1 hypothetical protein [Geodermatophilus sp. YIM 151500]